jgi:hypothetical protein
MKIEVFRASRRVLWSAALLPWLVACQVLPPVHSAAARAGIVRAQTVGQAEVVAEMLDRLSPAVIAALPDSRPANLEVWVQETPALYRFATSTYNDADGFWAAEPKRIHLRAGADDLERTLAHELVHSSLGRSWKVMPGTIEEGLCDVISAELCPESAARLRAGRLSSAAFATGGLVLELEVQVPADANASATTLRFNARLRLEGDPPVEVAPLDVFDVEAGLSSTSIATDRKKAFYGLAFLVAERIIARQGIEGFHALCGRAAGEDRSHIPAEWLIEAAGLSADRAAWQRAVAESIGPAELGELVRMHPRFLAQTVAEFLQSCLEPRELATALASTEARLRVAGAPASLSLWSLPEMRRELSQALSISTIDALASR